MATIDAAGRSKAGASTSTVGASPRARQQRPVPRSDGARNVRLLAVAFGVTVVATRLYLSLTGYPQIGGGEYHLAHALWGGLLLLVGSVLTLLWSNRWVQPMTAVCAGVGSGLFIDEVGKFITARNDYFTPLAAPIIYSAFLAVLGVAVLARRAPLDRPRALAYAALVGLKDLADGPLRPAARDALLRDLTDLERATTRPDLADLARRLRPAVESADVAATPQGRSRRILAVLLRVEQLFLPRWALRLVLAAGTILLGVASLLGLAVLLALLSADPDATVVLDDLTVAPGTHPPVLVVASAGEVAVGVLLLVSAGGMLLGRDRFGTACGRLGLVLGLAGVNVALGYLDAELVVQVVVAELVLLALIQRYRSRFLETVGQASRGA